MILNKNVAQLHGIYKLPDVMMYKAMNFKIMLKVGIKYDYNSLQIFYLWFYLWSQTFSGANLTKKKKHSIYSSLAWTSYSNQNQLFVFNLMNFLNIFFF